MFQNRTGIRLQILVIVHTGNKITIKYESMIGLNLKVDYYLRTKIYDNLNNRNNSNGTVKNNTKHIVETKKRDPCWLYGKITRG